jgi:hypothetical protein
MDPALVDDALSGAAVGDDQVRHAGRGPLEEVDQSVLGERCNDADMHCRPSERPEGRSQAGQGLRVGAPHDNRFEAPVELGAGVRSPTAGALST